MLRFIYLFIFSKPGICLRLYFSRKFYWKYCYQKGERKRNALFLLNLTAAYLDAEQHLDTVARMLSAYHEYLH